MVVKDDLENRTGEFDFSKLRIVIEKSNPHVMGLTLIHEIMHAMNNEVREDIVEFYAQSFYQVIQDNPDLFKSRKGGGK